MVQIRRSHEAYFKSVIFAANKIYSVYFEKKFSLTLIGIYITLNRAPYDAEKL